MVTYDVSGKVVLITGAARGIGNALARQLRARGALIAVVDLRPDDVYWCNADPGWVTGTSYGIIGPWANGVTQAVLDSNGGGDGDIDNTATAEGSYGAVTVQASGSTAVALVINPQLSITKTADDDTDVVAGQTITYTYVVTNTGNQTIADIGLSDSHNGSGPPVLQATPPMPRPATACGRASHPATPSLSPPPTS